MDETSAILPLLLYIVLPTPKSISLALVFASYKSVPGSTRILYSILLVYFILGILFFASNGFYATMILNKYEKKI